MRTRALGVVGVVCAATGAGVAAQDAAGFGSPDGRLLARVEPGGAVLETPASSHFLEGYPPPRARWHGARISRVEFDTGSRLVALAGRCRGYSGVAPPLRPSCADRFVRVYRTTDGSLVRDLAARWDVMIYDSVEARALAFDEHARRLAALVRYEWSDCSWGGSGLELHVWDLETGDLVARRVVSTRGGGGTYGMTFLDDAIVLKRGTGPHTRTRVVPIR
jgi:hypothetical protein